MKKYYSLLLSIFFIATANAHITTTSGEHSKLLKNQGWTAIIRCGLQDKAGNLWFGTTGEGVCRYDGKSFKNFTVKDGLNDNHVWCIVEDNTGNVWFGTTDGICRYDGTNFTRISIPQSVRKESSNSYYTDWSTKNTVWSIFQDKSGVLWFGTGDGIYCYDGISFINFINFLDKPGITNKDSLHLKMVDCIIEDDNGYIWFASGMLPGSEGLIRYDGKALTSFKLKDQEWINKIADDKKGNIWLATRHNGIVKYDRENFTSIGVGGKAGLAYMIDKSGKSWFSTNGEGENGSLWRYDGHTYTNFTVKDGLNKEDIWLILEDKNGNIWVGTRNAGLYRYDGKTFVSFTE